jgi:hypothetical protein
MPVSKHRRKEKRRGRSEPKSGGGGLMSSLRGGFKGAVSGAQKEGPVQSALTYILIGAAALFLLYRLGIVRF